MNAPKSQSSHSSRSQPVRRARGRPAGRALSAHTRPDRRGSRLWSTSSLSQRRRHASCKRLKVQLTCVWLIVVRRNFISQHAVIKVKSAFVCCSHTFQLNTCQLFTLKVCGTVSSRKFFEGSKRFFETAALPLRREGK